jgi:hypothetical protein
VKGNLAVSGEVFFRVAVLDAKFGAGNDISKKFNKFGIGFARQPPVPTLSFSKEFFDIFSAFDEKKWVFELFTG